MPPMSANVVGENIVARCSCCDVSSPPCPVLRIGACEMRVVCVCVQCSLDFFSLPGPRRFLIGPPEALRQQPEASTCCLKASRSTCPAGSSLIGCSVVVSAGSASQGFPWVDSSCRCVRYYLLSMLHIGNQNHGSAYCLLSTAAEQMQLQWAHLPGRCGAAWERCWRRRDVAMFRELFREILHPVGLGLSPLKYFTWSAVVEYEVKYSMETN